MSNLQPIVQIPFEKEMPLSLWVNFMTWMYGSDYTLCVIEKARKQAQEAMIKHLDKVSND